MLVEGSWRAIAVLVTACVAVIAGLIIFMQGFLLTRHVIVKNSTCQDFGNDVVDGCWLPRRFDRAVLLLIDGLRYDFAAYNHTAAAAASSQGLPHYINKMPVFAEILGELPKPDSGVVGDRSVKLWPGGGFLARFIADAPTTTMQRLKGLTTGTLPTFIDLASNFDSPELSEDSFVAAAARSGGGGVVVLGDDTWGHMFPKDSFVRASLFPSFNVHDLDTVDAEVWQQLPAELQRRDARLLIAHFLGVDHAGHRYGPAHSHMARKLTQMDEIVRYVAASIDADTLLVVFGDHGMTSSGDHGGDSEGEVTAAIFVYSPGLTSLTASQYSQHMPPDTSKTDVNGTERDKNSKVKNNSSEKKVQENVKNETTCEGSDCASDRRGSMNFRRPISLIGPQVVQQVSLAPTLSLLLGLPVPYSSLGSVMTELFHNEHESAALSVNVKQVHRYLLHYAQEFPTNAFPRDMWARLVNMNTALQHLEALVANATLSTHDFNELFDVKSRDVDVLVKDYAELLTKSAGKNENEEINSVQLSKIKKDLYLKYLTLAKVMCEEVWATFDINEMVSGILLMIVSILNLLCIVLSFGKSEENQMFFVKGNMVLTFVILITLLLKHWLRFPVLSYIPAFLSGAVLMFHVSKIISINLYGAYKDRVPLLLFLLICITSFSNSYVVYENLVIAFSLISLYVYQTLKILFVHREKFLSSKGKMINRERLSMMTACVAVSCCVAACGVVRITQQFYRCREEQVNCVSSTAYALLSSVQPAMQNTRYFYGLVVLFFIVLLPHWWLSSCGNLNGMRPAVLATKYVPMVCALMSAAYWALEAVPKPTSLIISYTDIPPKIVYTSVAVALIIIFIKPLFIFQLEKNKLRSVRSADPKLLIPELFQSLKSSMSPVKKSPKDDTAVVYGLATAVSAVVVAAAWLLLMVVVLVVGDGLAAVVLLMLLIIAAWLLLHSLLCWQNPILDSVLRLRWTTPVCWFLLSLHMFYALGHQPTFPTLPWSAAFVGFSSGGETGNLVPVLLVGLHTFAGHLLMGLTLPLATIAPVALAAILPNLGADSGRSDLKRGELILVLRPETCVAATTAAALAYFALHAVKVLFTCVACFVLRRHLMVWKVFAPHFVFEAAGLPVTAAAVVVGQLLLCRTLAALVYWTDHTLLDDKVKPL